jgi:hypothetical protein
MQSDDKQLALVLEELGLGASAFIARGGEATVYRYDSDHVARISHAWASSAYTSRREGVLGEVAKSAEGLRFAIPSVREKLFVEGRVVFMTRKSR